MAIEIRVIGTPATQGNHSKTKGGVIYETSKGHKPWRDSVAWMAIEARKGHTFDGPVQCEIVFSLQRPKTAPKRIQHPAKKPDIDKCLRSTLDALTMGGVWRDDSQVVSLGNTRKVFAGGSDPDALPVPGCVIRIAEVQV